MYGLARLIGPPKGITAFKQLILHIVDWLNETMKNVFYSGALWGEKEDMLRISVHRAI